MNIPFSAKLIAIGVFLIILVAAIRSCGQEPSFLAGEKVWAIATGYWQNLERPTAPNDGAISITCEYVSYSNDVSLLPPTGECDETDVSLSDGSINVDRYEVSRKDWNADELTAFRREYCHGGGGDCMRKEDAGHEEVQTKAIHMDFHTRRVTKLETEWDGSTYRYILTGKCAWPFAGKWVQAPDKISGKPFVVPYVEDQRSMYIKAVVNGKDTVALFDTGNAGVSVNLQKFGLSKVGSIEIRTANGNINVGFDFCQVCVRNECVMTKVFDSPDGSIAAIGEGFLSHFGKITIDPETHFITIQPKGAAPKKEE